MKVNELSELTGVGIETIRKYRNEGLLYPRQLSNGYYDYTDEDMVRLLYIRKLRGSGLSLSSIRCSCENEDLTDIYENMRQEYDELELRIRELTMRRQILGMTLQHFDICKGDTASVTEWEVEYESCCIPLNTAKTDSEARLWLSRVELTSQNLLIDMSALQDEPLPAQIPFEYGLACYMPVLSSHRLPVPAGAMYIPAGTYLTVWLEPEEPRRLSREQLRPLLEYAAAHDYRFTGPNSGFIYRIGRQDGTDRFLYRFRAHVVRSREGASGQTRSFHLELPCGEGGNRKA